MTLTPVQKLRMALWTRRFRGELLRRARSIADASTHEAEDAVQDTLLKAISHYSALEKKSDAVVLAYLSEVLRNNLRDRWRRLKTRKAGAGELALVAETLETPPGEVEAWRQLSDAQLAAAFEALPPQVLKAYRYRLEGLSYRQIAETMNVTSGTVGCWLFEAREQLREALLKPGREPAELQQRRVAKGES